jgi:TatD DNase family protein
VLAEILDACAAAGGRILSLHSRGATDALLDLLEFEPAAGRFVLHWFSAKAVTIERAAKLGCWFSVGPAMLASKRGRAAVASMPRDRILPETDGPFGSLDGESLEPIDSGRVHDQLAELWGMTPQEAAAKLLTNFRRLTAFSRRSGVRT